MNNQPNSTSAIEPRQESQSSEERFKITFWLGRYESHLYLNSPEATYERYGRVLSKFYEHFQEKKKFTYSFLRCDFEDYKNHRLREGASPVTVGMELTVLRGFWRWMLRMGAEGVLFNPVVGVKVQKPSKKHRQGESPIEVRNEATESPA